MRMIYEIKIGEWIAERPGEKVVHGGFMDPAARVYLDDFYSHGGGEWQSQFVKAEIGDGRGTFYRHLQLQEIVLIGMGYEYQARLIYKRWPFRMGDWGAITLRYGWRGSLHYGYKVTDYLDPAIDDISKIGTSPI